MSFTIDANDSRSVKALAIAAGASSWIRCTSRDGRPLVGVPSQCHVGTFYLVDVDRRLCDCQDFQRHGLSSARIGAEGAHGQCKHLRAALLHRELVMAQQQSQPKRGRLRSVSTTSALDRLVGGPQAS